MSKDIKLTQQAAITGGSKRIRLSRQGAVMDGNKKITLPAAVETVPSFTLSEAASTSAGVYDTNGKLVRTLWSGVTYPAGVHAVDWDGNNDFGILQPDGDYDLIVESNNCDAEWEGIIGNTSRDITGSTIHACIDFIAGITIQGNRLYYTSGYSELGNVHNCFDLNNPQVRIPIGVFHKTLQTTFYNCADATLVYWVGTDPWGNIDTSFVFASRVSDNTLYTFPTGTSYTTSNSSGQTYSAISKLVGATYQATGIAVQRQGNYLFVCRGVDNHIYVHNKTSGLLVQTLSFTACGAIAVDATDNTLWLEHSPTGAPVCEQFTINSDGTLTTTGRQITTIGKIGAIAVNATTLLIADASIASQQVKAFDVTTGTSLWVLGQAGGYSISPAVADDKFFFSYPLEISNKYNQVYHSLAWQDDGSFWVLDNPNYRLLHFSADRTLIEFVGYIGRHYTHSVNLNNPNRLMAWYLEFEIDYTKPLAQGWKLVNNWGYYAPLLNAQGRLGNPGKYATLSNGRTYVFMSYMNASGQTIFGQLFELDPAIGVRNCGKGTGNANTLLLKEGDYVTYSLITNTSTTKKYNVNRYPLSGFDTNNNPIWGAPVLLGSTGNVTWDDTNPDSLARNQNIVTDSGRIILLCTYPIVDTAGHSRGQDGWNRTYHLGAVVQGTDGYQWQTAKASYTNYTGPMPTDGTFDVGNGVNAYAGSCVLIEDNIIIWGYHGEFWKQAQANIWNQVSDIGLFVQQYGAAPGRNVLDASEVGYPEYAGNSFAASMFRYSSDVLYMFHNDEGQHGGLHRWKITGLETMQRTIIPITMNNIPQGLTGVYFDCSDHNSSYYRSNRRDAILDFTWDNTIPAGTSLTGLTYSVRWTGFLQAKYSETYTFAVATAGGIRVWLNKNLIIDQLTNTTNTEFSGNFAMVAGKYYAIKIEYSNVAANPSHCTLMWQSISQPKEIVPPDRLLPDKNPKIPNTPVEGIDLLADLPFNAQLTSGYGWTRTGAYGNTPAGTLDSYIWNVRTNLRKYKTNDITVDYSISAQSYEVRKDMGNLTGLNSWTLHLQMDMNGGYFNGNQGNYLYLELLDTNNKLLMQIDKTGSTVGGVGMRTIKINNVNAHSVDYHQFSVPNYDITFTYANGILKAKVNEAAEVVLPKLDATANNSNPGFLRFNALSKKAGTIVKNLYLGEATLYY